MLQNISLLPKKKIKELQTFLEQERQTAEKNNISPIISWSRMQTLGQQANITEESTLQRAVKFLHQLVSDLK